MKLSTKKTGLDQNVQFKKPFSTKLNQKKNFLQFTEGSKSLKKELYNKNICWEKKSTELANTQVDWKQKINNKPKHFVSEKYFYQKKSVYYIISK